MAVQDWLIPLMSAAGGIGTGMFATRQKDKTDKLTISAGKDEVVLVHYDKIVDQLQEEIQNLRAENAKLRENNLQLERDMLELNKQVHELTRELGNLKNWMASNLESGK